LVVVQVLELRRQVRVRRLVGLLRQLACALAHHLRIERRRLVFFGRPSRARRERQRTKERQGQAGQNHVAAMQARPPGGESLEKPSAGAAIARARSARSAEITDGRPGGSPAPRGGCRPPSAKKVAPLNERFVGWAKPAGARSAKAGVPTFG